MFKRGDHVIYTPFRGCPNSEKEEGIVKRMDKDGQGVFVLYHTSSMRYTEADLDNYTAAHTAIADLTIKE